MSLEHTTSKCRRCGTCCRKGGPVLHQEDAPLIFSGHIHLDHLVTLRKGEMAYNPATDKIEPLAHEMIKVRGMEGGWSCYYYFAPDNSCAIYGHRPLECRLLQCWDTSSLAPVIGQNTINRQHLLKDDDPRSAFAKLHEERCPWSRVWELIAPVQHAAVSKQSILDLTALAREDLDLRSRAVTRYGLSLGLELFLFGRPLFRLLTPFGITAYEDRDGLHLQRKGKGSI